MDLILCLFFLSLLILFLFLEPHFFKGKLKSNSEHGSASFAKKKEIKKNFKKVNLLNIDKASLPILFDKKLKNVWFDYETPHWCYLGATGSGKSSTSVIPFCDFLAHAKEKSSVFITDLKEEIFYHTSKMFFENGYRIITLDFRDTQKSNHINILETIILRYEQYMSCVKEIQKYETKKEISDTELEEMNSFRCQSINYLAECNQNIEFISSIIMNDKEAKDPFWNNSAKNLLQGIISLFLEEYANGCITRDQITLSSIKKFQNSSLIEENAEYLKKFIEAKPYGTMSKDSLISILSSSENTYKSITSVFNERMNIFDDFNVENILSFTDFDISILGKEATALYVIVPDEEKSYYELISIIIHLLYKELVRLANSEKDKKLKCKVEWILDEFANCPPLADISSMVSVSRSRGMRFHFYIQSFSQLNNVYGKEVAQTILDNCGLVYLKTNSQETAEAISRKLGTKTILSSSINYSYSTNNNGGTKSLIGRPLLTADEVKKLHHQTIIFPLIGNPILRDTVLYTKFPFHCSGKIERKNNPLFHSENSYFTVEKLISKKDNQSLNKEAILNQKQHLYKLFQELRKTFGNINYQINYEERGNEVIGIVTFETYLSLNKISQISSKIDEKVYIYQIINEDEEKIEATILKVKARKIE